MQLLSQADIACDVGANIGYYLLLEESVIGPEGNVLCIEPEPDNLVDLERTVNANQFANVRVLAAACGDRQGIVRISRGINSGVTESGELTVPVVTLDDVASPRTSFLKIDVEGFEGHVLEGARRLLREARPKLFLEVHPGMLAAPYTTDDIVRVIRNLYTELRFYAPNAKQNVFGKFAARYLGRGVVQEISDVEGLLAESRGKERRDPFWIIARP
jgi:FkbM family methyltransferase